MSRLLYLKKGEEPPAPFELLEYAEPDGGRLHGPSTLAKLRLATLEMKVSGTDAYVPVAFHTGTELSIRRFTANSQDAPLAVRGEGAGPGGGAEGSGDLLDAVYQQRLPSASDIGRSNKDFTEFLRKAPIAMGRTLAEPQQGHVLHGTPITTAVNAFSEFSFAAASGITPEACRLAQMLCNILCVVWTDEVKDLQVRLVPFVEQLVNGLPVAVIAGQRGAPDPDIRVILADLLPLLLVEIKLDTGGNTLGQALRYYFELLRLLKGSPESEWLRKAMRTPVFILEISGNRVRISAATLQHVILAEPLLDVTCTYDECSMTTLACGLAGLQHGLHSLAATYTTSPSRGIAAPGHEAFPEFLSELFPTYTFAKAFNSPRMWRIKAPPSSSATTTITTTINNMQVEAAASSSSIESVVKLVRVRPGDHALQAHRLLANLGCAPQMLSGPHRVSQDWWAVHMQLFRWQDGWWPLDVLHPRSTFRGMDPRYPALDDTDWRQLCAAAEATLRQIHQLQLPIPGQPDTQGPLVWGDARMANMLAKCDKPGTWRVMVIDLDWAGVAGVSRYPSTMNSQLWWPAGAGPAQLMQQVHDTQLLAHQLSLEGFGMSTASDMDARRAGLGSRAGAMSS